MMKKSYKDKAYMEVLMKLRRMIAEEYKDGGRLPPGREMCKKLNVCLPTYGKAIARLQSDGSVYKNSNKGIFVTPALFRVNKVGLVIQDGNESPFLEFQEIVATLLSELKKYNMNVQLIQSGAIENLPQKMTFHGVSSLLWLIDKGSPEAIIKRIVLEDEFPLVLLNGRDPDSENLTSLFQYNCVHRDYKFAGKKRAEILLKRNHKHILYAGSAWYAEYTTFARTIQQGGAVLHQELPLNTEKQVRDNLAKLIRENHVTALYSEGGVYNLQAVFEEILSLSPEERPEVLVTDFAMVPPLLEKYPEIKCIGKCGFQSVDIAEEAVRMLADYFQKGSPLHSIVLKDFIFT